ncbi:cytochrome D1 domain-containing protein [Hydrogenophaga sp.]|uniref:YVTN family beta-propeller repeat protein n=2 Tax=Hydrogenophaga sp. TaxID=1904254 RepID=UPI0026170C50|nr:cytochrome D1 domain-containing protein [Hydrogenophaga sp.]
MRCVCGATKHDNEVRRISPDFSQQGWFAMTRKNNWLLTAVQVGLLAWSGASFSADKVYVANEGADTVSVIDTTSFKTLASVRVGKMPHNVQVSPDGKFAWVTNNGEPGPTTDASVHKGMAQGAHEAMAQPGAVWVIDTSTNAVVAQVPVGMHPAHVVVSPDGRFAYVTNGGDNTVSVIDTSSRSLVATISVGQFPHGLRTSPDGKEVYVANLKGGSVSVIDTTSQKEVAKVPAGKGPAQTGFTPDGRFAFVSLSQENAVAMIDPATRKVVRKIRVGAGPIQLYATPDSRTLLVANQGTRKKPGKTVSLIDLQSFKVAKIVVTGAGAHGVVVDRDGRFAYVTNIYANSVSVLDVTERRVTKTVPVGKSPNGISITP